MQNIAIRSGVFLGALAKLLKVTISFVMSVCLSVRPFALNNSVLTARIFMKFYIWVLFEYMLSNLNFD